MYVRGCVCRVVICMYVVCVVGVICVCGVYGCV